MPKKDFFDVFFEEKDIPPKTFEVKDKNDNTHFIDNTFVINLIKSASPEEKKQIEDILRKIDFHNGDVNHFLEHLAKGYVMTHY